MFKVFHCPCGLSFGILNMIQDSVERLIKVYNSKHKRVTLNGVNGVTFSVLTASPDDFIKFAGQYFRRKGLEARVVNREEVAQGTLIEFEINL